MFKVLLVWAFRNRKSSYIYWWFQRSGLPSLFQAANVDTDEIKWVQAAEVKKIVSTFQQQQQL